MVKDVTAVSVQDGDGLGKMMSLHEKEKHKEDRFASWSARSMRKRIKRAKLSGRTVS